MKTHTPANRSRHLLLRLLLPALFVLLGCPAPAPPQDEIRVFGLGDTLTPGGSADFVAQLVTPGDPRNAANQRVVVGLEYGNEKEHFFRGRSDDYGLLHVTFDLPDDLPDPNAIVTLSADAGSKIVQAFYPVSIQTAYDVLLTTDKPVYQPGQTIHMRALALARSDLHPAQGQTVTFTVTDPKGNKLAREEVTTSDFGVAAADFALDTAAASGDYLLSVELGMAHMSSSVEVKPYVLPRFDVEFSTDSAFYLPGEEVSGTVSATYFFGKPVAGGTVALRGFVTDVSRSQEISLTGTTDADGLFTFTFTMPPFFVLQPAEDGARARTATLDVEVEVTDSAAHMERIDESITVGEERLLIEAVPEMGGLVAGSDNIVYINVTWPDGSAAPSDLQISTGLTETEVLRTDENGLARITLRANVISGRFLTIDAAAQERPEVQVQRRIWLRRGADLLIRPDKTEYAIGDLMVIDFYTPLFHEEGTASSADAKSIYLSIEKNGQSHALAELPLADGHAQAELEVTDKLLGAVLLRAATSPGPGAQVVAERYVLVNPPAAQISVQADAEVYAPGATATLDVQMLRNGSGAPGVLGVSIVDESVFALGDTDPGFARTYFLINRALQELPYSVSGFTNLGNDDPSPYDQANVSGRDLALAGLLAQETAARNIVNDAVPSEASQSAWAWLQRAPWALPMLGLALYDGSRKRRTWFFALCVLAIAALLFVSCAAPAMPAAPAPAAEAPAQSAAMEETTATRGSAPPRLRQFFPETLLWLPEVETDASGQARIEVPIADSITTWRVSLLASDAEGTLGSADVPLRVFQEFFIEPDLPTHLTVGDEVQIPVSIFNYLEREQVVTLSVEEAEWFEFSAEPQWQTTLAANEVGVVYLPIRVTGFGERELQITAQGESLSDAVLRTMRVVPPGELRASVESAGVEDGLEMALDVPESTMEGATSVTVRLYPGLLPNLTQGLESMLRAPHGCFEQVTSSTWPNVLILDYLRSAGKTNPELERQAKEFIRSGYQQLVNYEVTGEPGGFSWYGDPPPVTWLSAYGLMEFADMSRVAWVDPALIERTANFLLSRQGNDGAWHDRPDFYASAGENDALMATSFAVWALAEAGYGEHPQVQRGIDYIRDQLTGIQQPEPTPTSATGRQSTSPLPRPGTGSEAPAGPPVAEAEPMTVLPSTDPYVLALAANALVAAGEDATVALDLLAQGAIVSDDQIYWDTRMATWTGAWDWSADLETTAVAAHALLRGRSHPDLAQGALAWLLNQRGPYGGIGSTQTTVFALRALARASLGDDEEETTVTVTLDGREQTLVLPRGGGDVVQSVRFEGVTPGAQVLALSVEGGQRPILEVITEQYAPWPSGGVAGQSLQLDVTYDRTELAVNETVQATARIELLAPQPSNMLLVELGVPPGFRVDRNTLEDLAFEGVIDDYLVREDRIEIYLSNVAPNQPIEFSYTLQARLALSAQTRPSRVYDYYTPETAQSLPPQRIVVRLR